MFSLIDGTIEPDKGEILLPKKHRLGHVHQQVGVGDMTVSLLEYAERSIPGLEQIAKKISSLEAELETVEESRRSALIQRVGTLQSSGGWQMRAELARTLIGYPDTLLLDEPSNYLDVPAVEWLNRFLKTFRGTLLLISHDRYLLESLTDLTLEVMHGQATRYAGGFSYYVETKEGRLLQQDAARKAQERKRAQMERFIDRFRAKNTKASQVQSRIKMLDRIEEVDLPREEDSIPRIQIALPPHCGNEVVRLERMGHAYHGANRVLQGIGPERRRKNPTGLCPVVCSPPELLGA